MALHPTVAAAAPLLLAILLMLNLRADAQSVKLSVSSVRFAVQIANTTSPAKQVTLTNLDNLNSLNIGSATPVGTTQ